MCIRDSVGPAGRGGAQRGQRDVGARDAAQAGLHVLEGDRRRAVGGRVVELDDGHPARLRPAAVGPRRRPRPPVGELLRVGDVDDRLVPGELGGGAGEGDAREAAHGAVPAVAADQPAGAHRAVGGVDQHAVAGVVQPGDLHAAVHRHAEPGDVLGEQGLQLALRHHPRPGGRGVRGDVGIGPVHQVGVEHHPGEVPGEPRVGRPPVAGLGRAAVGPDPFQHVALHLFGGGQQAAAVERLGRRHVDALRLQRGLRFGQSFEHPHRRPGKRQLGGEHQAHRSCSDHGHVHVLIVRHEHCSIYERRSCQAKVVR